MAQRKDPFGEALIAYLNGDKKGQITVVSDVVEDDYIPVAYLFRNYYQMPPLEKRALSLCRGKILDVGAGSGCHSLYLYSEGYNITALEKSSLACEVIKQQGVRKVENIDFYSFIAPNAFDTILLLMNGLGIAGTLENLPRFLQHCKSILAPGGQIILDSSDLKYLFQEEDGSYLININDSYYGEVEYQMVYNNKKGEKFNWLFLDFDLLSHFAEENGLKATKIADGSHYDYLAMLTVV
ncbi:MAG: class I SAM-dependent methyltransferase [Breznakibacter sp.]|jgi:SAM-dependent methyltransferase|nr:class I SAM-dependent methyltransferase [Breznakibacter sp.]